MGAMSRLKVGTAGALSVSSKSANTARASTAIENRILIPFLIDSWGNRGAARIPPVFGAVELLGDQLSIPSRDGVGFGNPGDLREYFASQAPSDFGEGGALRVAQSQFRRRLCPQNPIQARYSFSSNSSQFTEPVTYATNRTHLLFLIQTADITVAMVRLGFLTIRVVSTSVAIITARTLRS